MPYALSEANIVVYVCATLLDLVSVNSRDQTWSGDLRLEFALAAPKAVMSSVPAFEATALKPGCAFAKQLFWPTLGNARRIEQSEAWLSTGDALPPGVASAVLTRAEDPEGKRMVALSVNMRVKGTFSQRFASLTDFPLDSQLLQLRISLEQGLARFATRAESAAVFPGGHSVLVEASSCSTLDEWRLGTTFGSITSQSSARRSRTGKRYSQWTGLLLVQRKAGHYLIGIAAPFLLQSVGMVLLFMNGSFAQRLTAGTTLILTARSMMERMQASLPQRDGFNLTLLERHFSANMALMLAGMAMAACGVYATPGVMEAIIALARLTVDTAAATPAVLAQATSTESVAGVAGFSAAAGHGDAIVACLAMLQLGAGYALRRLPGLLPAAHQLLDAAATSAISEVAHVGSSLLTTAGNDSSRSGSSNVYKSTPALAPATDTFLMWLLALLWLLVNLSFLLSGLRLALLGRPIRLGRQKPYCCCVPRSAFQRVSALACCQSLRSCCWAAFPSSVGSSACRRRRVFVDGAAGPEDEGCTFLEDVPNMFAGVDPADALPVFAADVARATAVPSAPQSGLIAQLRESSTVSAVAALPKAVNEVCKAVVAPLRTDAGSIPASATGLTKKGRRAERSHGGNGDIR